jgi:hypothetical protein
MHERKATEFELLEGIELTAVEVTGRSVQRSSVGG